MEWVIKMKNNQELEQKYQVKKLISIIWFFIFFVCVYFMQMFPNFWTVMLMLGALSVTVYYYLQYGKLKKQLKSDDDSKRDA